MKHSKYKNNSDFDITLQSVDAVKARLPDYPSDKIKECFQLNDILIDDADQIPRDFSKYFAVMTELAGGNLQGKQLLDVGTGLGVFISQAKCLGMIPTGVDIFYEYNEQCYQGALCVFKSYGHSIEDAQ